RPHGSARRQPRQADQPGGPRRGGPRCASGRSGAPPGKARGLAGNRGEDTLAKFRCRVRRLTMTQPFAGRRIALAEGRQLEDLAAMLEKEGATAVRCPMVSILDAPDPAPVVAWLRELVAGRFGYVVLLTGEGFRRLLGFAGREGLRDAAVAAFGKARTVTRGP